MRVQIVSFHCVLKNNLGQFISSSFNQEVSTAEENGSFPALVRVLKKLPKGKRQKVFVPANEGYGFYDPAMNFTIARSRLDSKRNLKVGDEFPGILNNDQGPRTYRVISATKKSLTLDGNHPLAGQDLVFEVEVTASRMEIEKDEPTVLSLVN